MPVEQIIAIVAHARHFAKHTKRVSQFRENTDGLIHGRFRGDIFRDCGEICWALEVRSSASCCARWVGTPAELPN